MDLQTRKITFVQEFLRLQNEDVISRLEEMLRKHRSELYKESFKPLTLQQLNNEIHQALNESEDNRVIKATDIKSIIEQLS